ncbi:serine protease [Patescibacteria group bacterium]
MKGKIPTLLALLVIGALGGVIFQAFILPYLATKPFFQRFQFVEILTQREVNVHPKETIIIQENTALKESIEKVQNAVMMVRASSTTQTVYGTALILSSDGLIVTLNDVLPWGYTFAFFWEGEMVPAEILKRDAENNLALIKVEKENLPTAGFANFEELRLGERVFLLGVILKANKQKKIVNEGIVKVIDEDSIRTNIVEKRTLQGSPLFNVEGMVVGINTIDFEGNVSAIPVRQIQEFAGF